MELLVVLAIIGVLLGIVVPRLQASMARHAVAAAARDVANLLSSARQIAATGVDGAAVGFDSASGQVLLSVNGRRVRALELTAHRSVSVQATRDSLAYDSRGLGIGAANLSIVLTRGVVAETLVVSRLGRLRY